MPRTQHTVSIVSTARAVYDLLSDVTIWPEMFEPTIHAEILGRRGDIQTIKLWALANGEPKVWTSERSLDDGRMTIGFRQTSAKSPIASMSGQWTVAETAGGACTVTLDHDFEAVGDDPVAVDWIQRAVDSNSDLELAALKRYAEERGTPNAPFTFSDSIVTVSDPSRMFEFIARGDLWDERLSHVQSVTMESWEEGLQLLSMVTMTQDNESHVTESIRVSQPPVRLLYKQTILPDLLSLHLGIWSFSPVGEQWKIESTHTVRVVESRVSEVLGPSVSFGDAKDLVRRNLGKNSMLTLNAADKWATSSSKG